MANELTKVAAPALPVASKEYGHEDEGAFRAIMRIFFNRFVGVIDNLLSMNSYGGKFLYMPYGDFYDTTTQTAAIVDTAYALTFDTSSLTAGVTLQTTSQILFEYEGIYSFHIYGHVNTTGTTGAITMWAKKNGTNIADSGRRVDASADLPIMFSGIMEIATGDYLEIMWETTHLNARFESIAASGNYPAVPSVSVAISYASNN